MSVGGYPWGRLVRAVVGPVLTRVYRTEAIGMDKVPAEGGAILSGNHASYLDPALLWCLAPRHVHFMAKASLFEKGFIAWALPRLWGFPVRRGEPDRAAISMATELLQAGDLVGIFPEGTRVRDAGPDSELGEAHGGAAFIAMRAGVPVIPIGITGADRIMPKGARFPRFPKVRYRFGDPIWPEQFTEGGRKERVAAMTSEIMRRIAEERALAKGAE